MHFRKEHKWKYVLVGAYFLLVLVSPLFFFSGVFQNDPEAMLDWIVSEENDQFFQGYIKQIQSNQIEESYSQLHPEIQKSFPIEDIERVAIALASSSDALELIGANIKTTNSSSNGSWTKHDVTYEVANNDPEYKFLLVQVVAIEEGGEMKIAGIHVIPETESIKEQRKVDFASQWPVILLAIVIPLFIIYTALHYLSKAKDPRWLILVMILFLASYLNVTGETVSIRIISLNSFASAEGLWGPIVFNTPLPLGVLIYWVRRKKILSQSEQLTTNQEQAGS